MPLFWVSLAVALEVRSSASSAAQLATAALASPRPRECRGSAGEADGLWARARAGDAQRYCELLARGYARLTETPAQALSAAEAAEALAGPIAQVLVLNGRAKLRLGQASAALAQFAKAEARDSQAFLDPKALHDYARAASSSGKPLDAVRLYRMLVSRSALLDDAREQSVLAIEAAAHVLAYAPGGSDEALGYLAQARRASLGLAPWITALRVLAAERNGRVERAPGGSALPSVAALTQPVSAAIDQTPLLPPGELEALRAVLTEPSDLAASRQHWNLFLARASAENVWLAQARKKRAEPGTARGKAR
jgi:hypothetical protein